MSLMKLLERLIWRLRGFIDGIDVAYACDVKGWQHRGVDRPNNEIVIRGPQESFNEILRVNTALVRKILKDEDLVAESIEIGKEVKLLVHFCI